jgi:spermidine synthase
MRCCRCISARRTTTRRASLRCSAIYAPRSRWVRTLGTSVPLYGSLWMMAIVSDTLDPAALPADTLAERLAMRGIDSLRHYEPALHAGLFSAARSVRDKLSALTKPPI